MTRDRSAVPGGHLAATAIVLELLLAVGALAGGLALMAGPGGQIIQLPVSELAGSPFTDYFVPGAVLFTVLGVGPLVAALFAWRRHPLAPLMTVAVGARSSCGWRWRS